MNKRKRNVVARQGVTRREARVPKEGETVQVKVDDVLADALRTISKIYPRLSPELIIRQSLCLRAQRLTNEQQRFTRRSKKLTDARKSMPALVAQALEEAAR